MGNIKYIVLVLIGMALGIGIGMVLKTNPFATIELKNLSSKHVQTVSITVGMTTYVLRDIEQSAKKSLNVVVAGEVGYTVKVDFANGDTLVNWNYIDSGNNISEVISDKNIVSRLIK